MDFDAKMQSSKPDMTGWSDAKKKAYTEVKAKGGTWLSDAAYEAKTPTLAKPMIAKPQVSLR